MGMVNQYDLFWVNLDPTIGSEISKIRPCVVVSPNELNHYLNTVVIAPVTKTIKAYPSRFGVEISGTKGSVALDQIRTIDIKRLTGRIGSLDEAEIKHLKGIMKELYVD